MYRSLFTAIVIAAVALVASSSLFDIPSVFGGDESVNDVQFMSARPTYDQDQFIGKNILVTGGSSGIGYATALTLARFGAHVIFCSRDSNPSWFTGKDAETRINNDDIVKEKNGSALWIKADVADKESISGLFNSLELTNTTLHFAVNNAGIVGAVGALEDVAPYYGGVHDAIRNNLIGTVNCLELEIAHFKKHNQTAAIVNLASVNGYRAAPRGAMYAASKFGIVGLTRSVGVEYARGEPVIRVNAIAPGFTNTSLVWQQAKLLANATKQVWEGEYVHPGTKLWEDYKSHFQMSCPTGDIADPMDQANMIAFLLAQESELITGSIFTVDGMIGEE